MSIQNVECGYVNQTQQLRNVKQPVNNQNLNVDLSTPEDSIELSTKKEIKKKASIAKKVGVGLASRYLPGLGQVINGQGKKGAIQFISNTALKTAAIAFAFTCPHVSAVLSLGRIALNVGSIVDAVKNA